MQAKHLIESNTSSCFKYYEIRVFAPLYTVLANMYLRQSVKVKWNNYICDVYPVTNGFKQGGVLSPILCVNYIDELFTRLRDIGVGCFIGGKFCGECFGYDDDVTLLAPTHNSLRCLLANVHILCKVS